MLGMGSMKKGMFIDWLSHNEQDLIQKMILSGGK